MANQFTQEGRVPPQAVEVEEAILGAMLIEYSAATEAIKLLLPSDFYKPGNGIIFEALRHLYDHELPLDLLSVENYLRDQSTLDTVGGGVYLSDLTRSVSSAANIEYHARIVIEKSNKRKSILLGTDFIKESYELDTDPDTVINEHISRLEDISAKGQKHESTHIKESLHDYMESVDEAYAHYRKTGTAKMGITSGLAIDELTYGWNDTDLIILAARPSMGKTAAVLSMAKHTSIDPPTDQRNPIAIFTLEMSTKSLINRFVTNLTGISSQDIRVGRLKNDAELNQIIETAGNLFSSQIFIDETPAITLREVRNKCRVLKRKHGIKKIVIDYLQLMQGNSKNSFNREQEIAEISRGLKQLAKELNTPVIALSQLSRKLEDRPDKRPRLSDLRESGSIEQDADTVIFLHRPEYYGITTTPEGQSTAGLAEFIVAKQREGPVGSKFMHFDKRTGSFASLKEVSFAPSLMDKAQAMQNKPIPPHHLDDLEDPF